MGTKIIRRQDSNPPRTWKLGLNHDSVHIKQLMRNWTPLAYWFAWMSSFSEWIKYVFKLIWWIFPLTTESEGIFSPCAFPYFDDHNILCISILYMVVSTVNTGFQQVVQSCLGLLMMVASDGHWAFMTSMTLYLACCGMSKKEKDRQS